jgi:hypothetical protein
MSSRGKEEDAVATSAIAMLSCGWCTTTTHVTRAGIDRHTESGWSEEEAVARTTAVMTSSELWAASTSTST